MKKFAIWALLLALICCLCLPTALADNEPEIELGAMLYGSGASDTTIDYTFYLGIPVGWNNGNICFPSRSAFLGLSEITLLFLMMK